MCKHKSGGMSRRPSNSEGAEEVATAEGATGVTESPEMSPKSPAESDDEQSPSEQSPMLNWGPPCDITPGLVDLGYPCGHYLCRQASKTFSFPILASEPPAGPSTAVAPPLPEEDEFRGRSFSLTPTINFALFETDSSSESDLAGPLPPAPVPTVGPLPPAPRAFPASHSAAQLSLASSYGDTGAPICKICHMVAREGDPLISPCRCSGTMQYIHCGCLMKWLEISSKKSRKPPACELCQYQYHWHKKFKVRHWQFPHCSRKDKILHLLFLMSVLVMVACATVTILCFKQDKGTRLDPDRTELTHSEIVTLACGVLFFLAFFVAMYVEVKARNTIYRLALKFFYLNQQWYIDEYEKKDHGPVDV